MDNLAHDVLKACRNHGLTLATAESCTGGMVAAALTDIAGSSDVVDRGYVTYSNCAKIQMLDVKETTLATYGAVSEQVAHEMSLGALTNANVDISVAITGIAGPGPSEHKPEGRVCFATALKDNTPICQTVEFGAIGRANVRREATYHALKMIMSQLDILA